MEVSADVLIASNDADLLAARIGFTDHERAELRLAVRELATNLIRHAGGGTITVTAFEPRVTIEASAEGRRVRLARVSNLGAAFRWRGESLG